MSDITYVIALFALIITNQYRKVMEALLFFWLDPKEPKNQGCECSPAGTNELRQKFKGPTSSEEVIRVFYRSKFLQTRDSFATLFPRTIQGRRTHKSSFITGLKNFNR